MKRLLLLLWVGSIALSTRAQLLSWTPAFPKESDPAQSLVITMDASKGNNGLLNYTPVNDVYVHIGVITTLSADSTDWKHVPFTWASTNPAANAVSLGSNKWQYTISGSLRSFFNITDPSEHIKKIAILFRNGNGSRAQRNADGSDMFIPVYDIGPAVRIDAPPSEPKYHRVGETQSWAIGYQYNVTVNASQPSTITILHAGDPNATSGAGVTTFNNSYTVSDYGSQVFIAAADNGSTIVYDTLRFFIAPPASPVAALPAGVKDGINYEAGDTSVTLVLRAPGKNIVGVIGDFNNWTLSISSVMNKTPDGKFFWLKLHPLVPGTEYAYQYVVDNSLHIADPYAEKILDPANDPFIAPSTYPGLKPYPSGQTGIVSVLQTGAPAYNWSSSNYTRPDKRGLVIYELLLRDFVAAHDWKTLRDSLNYLQHLGINAIEIMPFNEFEGNSSWGYNPDFYFAPDKYYGPANTLKAFVDSCHRRGIAVIMDIALNHSFGQSPMVQLYWDAALSRPAANNPWFNPVPRHAFNVGFDMNHESADTKYYVDRIMQHWTQQYRIDGFRFDLSKGFTQTQTCDNNGGNCDAGQMAAYDASRVAIWKKYYDSLQAASPGAYAILEHFADNTEERELADYGMLLWGNMNYNYGQASIGDPNGWDFSNAIHSVRNFPKPHLVSYMESHDEERIVYKNLTAGNAQGSYNIRDTAIALKRMELDAAFLFTIPGPKMIWQFGELGYDYPINYCTNGTINNSCRLDPKPIRWDYLADSRRRSVLNTYSRLLALRAHSWYREAFRSGSIDRNLSGAIKWIRVNSGDTSELVVVGNFGLTTLSDVVTFPVAGTWYDYLNNNTITATGNAQLVSLQPGEFHVYVNRNVNNLSTTPVSSVDWNDHLLGVLAYPNPVNGSFFVKVQMPKSGTVHMKLYNVAGQQISDLYEGFLPAGIQSRELKPGKLPSGVYLLEVSALESRRVVQVIVK